jgi:uncharacterized protein YqjF (DUF2071 family)
MTFLKAKWKNLILVNYKINPKYLEPYIPKETTLDLHQGHCYISLVGFMFLDTKVFGIKCPFHINFEEVNLRFYVKHKEKRGVVFIKEIVTKPLIPCIANTIYKEHYQTLKMKHLWEDNRISYSWKTGNTWHSINANIENEALKIQPFSEEEFITEHYFGYTKHGNTTFEYEVKHPKWKIKKVTDYKVNVDFAKSYGKKFQFLNTIRPSSIILAIGSEIRVMNKTKL